MLVLLFAAFAGMVLSGCGSATVSDGVGGHKPSEKEAKAGGPREENDSHELPEPPGSRLSHGRETVNAGLGSYCWERVCADTFAVPVSEEVLTAPAGSTLTFAYAGKKLDSLSVSAQRIDREDSLKRMAGGTFLVPENEGKAYEQRVRLQTRRSENRARIDAELPAGEYAVEAFARFPGGDAFYGFHVVVE
ncbi:MAG: hypothetical protein M3151_08730 [Actinomycetota bacterium]|nr:hypothetical protein [Actinomycetota bacterium]